MKKNFLILTCLSFFMYACGNLGETQTFSYDNNYELTLSDLINRTINDTASLINYETEVLEGNYDQIVTLPLFLEYPTVSDEMMYKTLSSLKGDVVNLVFAVPSSNLVSYLGLDITEMIVSSKTNNESYVVFVTYPYYGSEVIVIDQGKIIFTNAFFDVNNLLDEELLKYVNSINFDNKTVNVVFWGHGFSDNSILNLYDVTYKNKDKAIMIDLERKEATSLKTVANFLNYLNTLAKINNIYIDSCLGASLTFFKLLSLKNVDFNNLIVPVSYQSGLGYFYSNLTNVENVMNLTNTLIKTLNITDSTEIIQLTKNGIEDLINAMSTIYINDLLNKTSSLIFAYYLKLISTLENQTSFNTFFNNIKDIENDILFLSNYDSYLNYFYGNYVGDIDKLNETVNITQAFYENANATNSLNLENATFENLQNVYLNITIYNNRYFQNMFSVNSLIKFLNDISNLNITYASYLANSISSYLNSTIIDGYKRYIIGDGSQLNYTKVDFLLPAIFPYEKQAIDIDDAFSEEEQIPYIKINSFSLDPLVYLFVNGTATNSTDIKLYKVFNLQNQ